MPEITKDGEDRDFSGFDQVNAILIDRGLLDKALDVKGLSTASIKTLSNLLHSMIAQREKDSDFREELSSKNRVLESSLERTKKFWREDEEKRAECERKLESSKASTETLNEELKVAKSSLKRTKEELQKCRKDLLVVKQQAAQQKLASERQLERLRARFTEEGIKSLRNQAPNVFVAGPSKPTKSLSRSVDDDAMIGRRQIEELEHRRRELMDYNAALKRMATECINLARRAASHMHDIVTEQSEGNTTSMSKQKGEELDSVPLYQRDLFPPFSMNMLKADYDVNVGASKQSSISIHPAVLVLSRANDSLEEHVRKLKQGKALRTWARIQEARRRMRESISSIAIEKATEGEIKLSHNDSTSTLHESDLVGEVTAIAQNDHVNNEEVDKLQHLLARAMERNQELEEHIDRREREMEEMDKYQSEDVAERTRHLAEAERQRQRYLELCRALEQQEEELAREREQFIRQREQETLEHSLSMVGSSTSVIANDLSQHSHQGTAEEDITANESQETTFHLTTRPAMLTEMYESTPQIQNRSIGMKRSHPDVVDQTIEKENSKPATTTGNTGLGMAKRIRTATGSSESKQENKTATQVIGGTEMRFITMRKQRSSQR